MQLVYWEIKRLIIVNMYVMHVKVKNIFISQSNNKGLEICFASYVHEKLVKMLHLYYFELVEMIEKHDEKSI